jgi:hypothetical protein
MADPGQGDKGLGWHTRSNCSGVSRKTQGCRSGPSSSRPGIVDGASGGEDARLMSAFASQRPARPALPYRSVSQPMLHTRP